MDLSWHSDHVFKLEGIACQACTSVCTGGPCATFEALNLRLHIWTSTWLWLGWYNDLISLREATIAAASYHLLCRCQRLIVMVMKRTLLTGHFRLFCFLNRFCTLVKAFLLFKTAYAFSVSRLSDEVFKVSVSLCVWMFVLYSRYTCSK